MTSNRKAKAAARALADDSGRSYTHARRVESGQDAEAAGFPRFPADAVLTVDAHNGAEQWTGQQWNEYAEACERSGGMFAVRLLRILEHGNGQGADSGPLAEAHREALAYAELLEAADPFLIPWSQAARRLADVVDPAEFYAGAQRLAQDVDDLRATPNGHDCDALFRWTRNPVDVGYALVRRARMVALDRCELDEHDRPCSGPRTLTLSVWTVDGLSEVWEPLCVDHAVDYALRWDPSYAELVVSGEPEHDARHAIARLLATRPGEMNARTPRAGEDRHGKRLEASASVVDDGRGEIHYPEPDRADDGPAGFAESWAGSTVTPEQLVADARAAVAEQYPDTTRGADPAPARLCSGCRGEGIIRGEDPEDDGTECTVCDGTGLARPHGVD